VALPSHWVVRLLSQLAFRPSPLCTCPYLHSLVTWSKAAVISPFALIVRCIF
jgi:hypothetical protein